MLHQVFPELKLLLLFNKQTILHHIKSYMNLHLFLSFSYHLVFFLKYKSSKKNSKNVCHNLQESDVK